MLNNADNSKILYKQHKQIYDAIKQGNPEYAVVLIKRHVDFVKEMNV